MLLKKKDYESLKVKTCIKKDRLVFFFNGVNRSSKKLVYVEQKLKTLGYYSYKILNQTAIRILNNSVYLSIGSVFEGLNFFIKPLQKCDLRKNVFQKTFEPSLFFLTAVKVNNKIYSGTQVKRLHSVKYSKNKLLLYQFIGTNLKHRSV